MSVLAITRASPMTTIQDEGRPGLLAHGIGASGPMDRHGYRLAERIAGTACGAAIEIGPQGLDFTYSGPPLVAGFAGGAFRLRVDGERMSWPAHLMLLEGASVSVTTGREGNYAYARFGAQIDVPDMLGSRATNATVGLGGLNGRALKPGDALGLVPLEHTVMRADGGDPRTPDPESPIRFVWGIHADLFAPTIRSAFAASDFRVSARMDRMGVRLDDREGVFRGASILGLVSDAVVPGDIQILGDGTPIVLMRDNQPTGGYPRIGTIIDADLDRFAQLRPGRPVRFTPVTVEHAHAVAVGRR